MLQLELNSIKSLVPRQWCYKYFDRSPLQLLFVHLCLKEISMGIVPKSAPGRQVFKIKTNESEY